MKRIIVLALLLVVASSCQKESPKQQPLNVGDFTFSSETIEHNKTFTIEYNGEGELENSFYHYGVHDKFYPFDLEFTENNARLEVPDSVAMVSFYFRLDKELDTNSGTGYFFFTLDDNGEMAIDAKAVKENYLINQGAFYNLKGGDAKNALTEIESALDEEPLLEDDWYRAYLQIASRVDKNKLELLIDQFSKDIRAKENLNLSDYEKLNTIYSAARQYEKLDSIKQIVIEKFPESTNAKGYIVENYFENKTYEDKLNYYNEKGLDSFTTDNMNYVNADLAKYFYRIDDKEKFEAYLNKVDKVRDKTSLLNTVAWGNAEKEKDLDYSARLSKQSLELIRTEMEELNQLSEFYSPNEYKDQLNYYYQLYADTYAYIQDKLGNLDEAIAYQKKAVGEGYNPEFNERYIQFLMADEQYDKAIDKASVFIKEGNATAAIKDDLKSAYAKARPETEFAPVLAQLENEAREKLKNAVKKKLLDEDSTDFSVKNLDGEDVALSDYLGKTVILDFWATWCGPCISSFPGMQKAIDKYKDNENVVFLFIDTFENGKTREESVQSFIDKNNYDFHVLIDPYMKDTSSYEIASAYNVSGIPTKIIIDKEGKMRFKDVGFSGSTDKLVSTLDAMVELIQ